jgi:hypothetical protein
MLPVLIEEQDRAKQASKLSFHYAYQVLQYLLQRSIARYHLQNTALSITQRLRPLALRDIRHGPHEFKVTRFIVCRGTTHNSNVLHRAIRHQQPMLKIKSFLIPYCLIEGFSDEGSVLRMSSLQYDFHSRCVGWVVFKN